MIQDRIIILDFGSQYTQLIARRLREMKVYSEIYPYNLEIEKIKKLSPKGIILSGGPSSVGESGAPNRSVRELKELAPILGICYGMQLIAHDLGGQVLPSVTCEYGLTSINWKNGKKQNVWMSHGDTVKKPPSGFKELAWTESGALAAMESDKILALQFHPEVYHTEGGDKILSDFVFKTCDIKAEWDSTHILEEVKEKLKKIPNHEKILCALSGGVDSTVAGVVLTKFLGKERVQCVFVDNGLLRKNEYEEVLGIYKKLSLNVDAIDARVDFLSALESITDPEKKRKIIGNKFIEIFERYKEDHPEIHWLAQGTLYPDVIESVSHRGSSVTIKTHHNVGGLPEKMKLKLIEPFRELFKDEVRNLGKELNIPEDILFRHPFPGPGLAVRCLGEVNKEALEILKECDAIFIDELKKAHLYSKIWQAFCVLLPIKTVGVQGDSRSYERSIALRAVTSQDGMTADWFFFDHEFLRKVSSRITNEVKKINRVVLDVTSKPPGTIEWE